MKKILNHLFENRTFTRDQAYEILTNITAGTFNVAQISAFLTAYNMRSIRDVELEGFRDAMYDLCLKVDFSDYQLIDLCGTGGDGKNTFNISTLASFVVAGAGYKVAKHGNYGVSSACGSSNVMEYLGYTFSNDPKELYRGLEKANITFLHAPLFHPAMKSVAPIRRDLGAKTFFNMLGPLVNPANPQFQSVGVFSLELARLYGYLYQKSNKKFSIIHALDGYDEISLTGDFKLITNAAEEILSPKDLGLAALSQEAIYGGETVEDAAGIFLSVLKGEGTAGQNSVVLANAAVAIQTFEGSRPFKECYALAQESLDSGKAYASLKTLLN